MWESSKHFNGWVIGREAEIFRLLSKDDSITTTSGPGVMFHVVNRRYNKGINQSKWILTERKHLFRRYIKPNIDLAPILKSPIKTQRMKQSDCLNWSLVTGSSPKQYRSKSVNQEKCVKDRRISTYIMKNIHTHRCIYMQRHVQY